MQNVLTIAALIRLLEEAKEKLSHARFKAVALCKINPKMKSDSIFNKLEDIEQQIMRLEYDSMKNL